MAEENKSIGSELRGVIDAPPETRNEIWTRALPTLRTLHEEIEWPNIVPSDNNVIVALVMQATALRQRNVRQRQDLASDEVSAAVAPLDGLAQDQAASGSETYGAAWNVMGGGDEPAAQPREAFRRLTRRALVALGVELNDPADAVDCWLDVVHEFHSDRQSQRYTHEYWRLKQVLEASAEFCAEMRTRAHEAGDSEAEANWTEIERQFRESPDPHGNLYAIRRWEGSRFQRAYADLQAKHDRLHGKPTALANRLEELIRSGRKYAEGYLTKALSPAEQIAVTQQVRLFMLESASPDPRDQLRRFIAENLPFERLHDAVWKEGYPSLEECANAFGADNVFNSAPKKAENACSEPPPTPGLETLHKRGRPKSQIAVDGAKIKGLHPGLKQEAFAGTCGISVDVLQTAENREFATLQTLTKICRHPNAKELKLKPKDLKKIVPQKPQE